MPGRRNSRLQQTLGDENYPLNLMPLTELTALLVPWRVAEDIVNGYLCRTGSAGLQSALSPEEETEFLRYNYRSRLPVFISGNTLNRTSNIIRIDEINVNIGDVPFALFLRLVAELLKNNGGVIRKSRLINAGYIKADGEFQAVGRLRRLFQPALGGLDPKDFIESCKPGCLRLSTHPAMISYDKTGLLAHRNIKIRRLARHLP